MQVNLIRRVDSSTDEVIAIEFSSPAEGEDFKEELLKWLRSNYPDMTLQKFFQRLMIFQVSGYCSISMTPTG